MDINAMMLVYFKESKRRRKERGITTSLAILATRKSETEEMDAYIKQVTQKCLSTRNGIASAPSLNPLTTPGMRSPMIIK
jgi:hypothetical protein